MPTYEYECEAGHVFEEVQSIRDEPLQVCPLVIPFSGPDFEKCEAPVKRLISRTSFILKGSGWSKDNYSKKKKGKSDAPAERANGKREGHPAGESPGHVHARRSE